MATQASLHGPGREQRAHHPREDPLLLEARKQVGQQVALLHESLRFRRRQAGTGAALPRADAPRRIQRHGGIVVAVKVEHDMPEHLEVLANLAIAVDVVEARKDLDHRPALGCAHLGHEPIERAAGPLDRHQQQAEVDEQRDRERNIIPLREPRLRGQRIQLRLALARALDRLDGPLLQLPQLLGAWRHLECQCADQAGRQAPERLDHRLRAFNRRDLRLLEARQLVDGAHDALQCSCELGIRTLERAASRIGERGAIGAIGEVRADLLQLRVGAKRVEPGDRHVEPPVETTHEVVARAAPRVDRGAIVRRNLSEVAVEATQLGLDRRDARAHEVGGELEAPRIVVPKLPARPVSGAGRRTRGAGLALLSGLLGGELRQGIERALQLLEAGHAGMERILHLTHRRLRRSRSLAAAFENLPVEAEAEADRDQRQEQVAADEEQPRRPADVGEDLIEQPHDHDHQHRHGEADDDLVRERQVADVGLDQLEHADERGDPRQPAEAHHEQQALPVAEERGRLRRLPVIPTEVRAVGEATSRRPALAAHANCPSTQRLLRYAQ